MAKDATTATAAWVRGMGQASQKMTDGVNAVNQSPGQAAAAKADTWQIRVSSADAKAKFIRKTSALSLGDWKNAMLQKGISRVSSGAQAAQSKMLKHLSAFIPFVQNIAANVRNMPNATLEDRIARMTAQVRATAQFQSQ